jgi:hypothetical protein
MNMRSLAAYVAIALLAFGAGYAFHSKGSPTSVAGIGSSDDPVAALAAVLAIDDAHARTRALLDFFAEADPAWAERLRAEVNQPESKVMLDEAGELLFAAWWARSNPKAAFTNRVDPPWPNRHPWLREVMKAWVHTDPTAAALAADTLPPNPDRGKVEATRILVDHWWDNGTATDPKALLALLYKLEVRPRASAIERFIQSSIEHRGIDATEQFVESVPQSDDFTIADVRQEMLGRYGQALLDHDAARAARWAEAHSEGRSGAGILRHLAFSWGIKDGPGAMDWAMKLPETSDRSGVLMRVWLSFRQAHPDEAQAWLLAHEPSDLLSGIYSRYLSGTATVDAKKALAIAEGVQDPGLRTRLLVAVGMGWMHADPAAALKWLDTVELPAEMESQIRDAKPATSDQTMMPLPTN